MSMKEKYKIRNLNDKAPYLCNNLNSLYNSNNSEIKREIPTTLGDGYFKRIILSEYTEIIIFDMTVGSHTVLECRTDTSICSLIFPLADPITWQSNESHPVQELNSGVGLMCIREDYSGIISIPLKHRFYGLTIKVDMKKLETLLQNNLSENHLLGYKNGDTFSSEFISSPTIKFILKQILECSFNQPLWQLYLESKILELLFVCYNEIIKIPSMDATKLLLSSIDIHSLHKAKEILDSNIVSPPSIKQLSKMIFLNEFKLKTGFRYVFGKPVRSYVIDKRLQMARILLEENELNISKVANLVGYSNLSYFASKFKEKYGLNPREYLKVNSLKR